jgi:hypothetical protein
MGDRGFESDAAFFDLVARSATDPVDRDQLRQVADKYRALAQQESEFSSKTHISRADYWRHRARECRALAKQFTSTKCREQLKRLADTYDQMAAQQAE